MGIKSFIAGVFLLLFSYSPAMASLITVFGPQKLVPKMSGPHHRDFSFSSPAEGTPGVVTLRMGDGTDLSPKSCSGKSLVIAKCKIENALRALEVMFARPRSIDISLNGQILVNRSNYNAATGILVIATKLKVSNSVRVLAKGLPTSSASLLVQTDIQVQQPLPLASFSMTPEAGVAPQTVVFNAMLSSSQGGVITSYEWDFADGYFAAGALVTHTFNSSGLYPVRLTVTDNLGQKATLTKNLLLAENFPPVADFVFTMDGLNITFDASASIDRDGFIGSYEWHFGD